VIDIDTAVSEIIVLWCDGWWR